VIALASASWLACGDNGGGAQDASIGTPDGPGAPTADAASDASDVVADASADAAPADASADASLLPDGPPAVPTAFRVTSLQLLDPHLMAEDAGCADADLTGFVNDLIAGTLTDQDADNFLDFAPVMVFRPLQQGQPSGPADFVVARCTAASPVTCTVGADAPTPMVASNQATGSCLGPLDGTTGGYTPGVEATPGPCFVTGERSLALTLSAIQVQLIHAQIAATYTGDPATGATSGLLRGFMTEAVAEATRIDILDTSLAALLPGSSSNGCRSDRDAVDGERGWWFYLAFTAEAVAWTD
jgi:hypothetical protein